MFGVAFSGAFSRKLRNRLRPSLRWMVMNPPPPMLPQHGCTTASAKPTATAASTALPPRLRMSTPTIVARCCALTTMACLAVTGLAFSSATRVMTGSRPVESGLTSCAQAGAPDAAKVSARASAACRQRGMLRSDMVSSSTVIGSSIVAGARRPPAAGHRQEGRCVGATAAAFSHPRNRTAAAAASRPATARHRDGRAAARTDRPDRRRPPRAPAPAPGRCPATSTPCSRPSP